MSHSSIFNFESLRTVRPALPRSVLVVVALIAALEVLARCLPAELLPDPASLDNRMQWMDENIMKQCDQPQVVVLGSSRAVFGITPKVLEQELGLPERSCVNASIISGGPEAAALFYDRHREKLGRAKLVLFVVDEWHFNSRNGAPAAPTTESDNDSPALALAGRGWHVLQGEVLSLKFVTFGERLPRLARDVLQITKLRPPRTLPWRVDDKRQVWFPPYDGRHRSEMTDAEFRTIIESYYHRFSIDPALLDPVRHVVRQVKESGGHFILLQLPNRQRYHQEVLRTRGREYGEHLKVVKELARELNVPFHPLESPADCGLSEECYHDGVHLLPAGSWRFTRFLAKHLSDPGCRKWSS